jgi:hypothetical protein
MTSSMMFFILWSYCFPYPFNSSNKYTTIQEGCFPLFFNGHSILHSTKLSIHCCDFERCCNNRRILL